MIAIWRHSVDTGKVIAIWRHSVEAGEVIAIRRYCGGREGDSHMETVWRQGRGKPYGDK